jgi:hypothetical protein
MGLGTTAIVGGVRGALIGERAAPLPQTLTLPICPKPKFDF